MYVWNINETKLKLIEFAICDRTISLGRVVFSRHAYSFFFFFICQSRQDIWFKRSFQVDILFFSKHSKEVCKLNGVILIISYV